MLVTFYDGDCSNKELDYKKKIKITYIYASWDALY